MVTSSVTSSVANIPSTSSVANTPSTSSVANTPSISSVANAFLTSIGDYDENAALSTASLESKLSGDELLHQLKEKIKTRYLEVKQVRRGLTT